METPMGSNEGQQVSEPGAPRPPGAGAEGALARLRAYAQEHPAVAIGAAVGTGALVGVQFAAGALVGAGAAWFVTGKKTVPELRDELRERGQKLWRRGRALVGKS